MFISWLKRVVVFFALSSAMVFVLPQVAHATGELYNWGTYDTIVGGGGAFQAIAPTNSAPAAYFKQDPENPKVYKATELPDCEGAIILTISNLPTKAKVTVEGDCAAFKDYDTDPVIQRLQDAVDSTDRDMRALQKLHADKACSGSDLDGAACRTSAESLQSMAIAACSSAHDYKSHVTVANAYLDCLAESLGVERPKADDPAKESSKEDGNACTIPDPGWALCQIIETTSNLTDNTFQLLQPFLELEPLTTEIGMRPGETTAYIGWKSIRDIANVALVIAFFIVIYSYITGMGMGAYSIKKSFPRLIVAAILINLSFFVTGAMVDLSNIFGRSLQAMSTEFGRSVVSESDTYSSWTQTSQRITSLTPTDESFTDETTAGMTNSERAELGLPPKDPQPAAGSAPTSAVLNADEENDPVPTIMIMNGVTLTGTAVLYANLAILIPLMVAALFSMFITLMILLLRQALVIILVVIAPLAIAAYILPGTKQYFDKWKSTFTQLLMLYPIIALIYASSVIASTVIRESALNNGQTLLAMFSMGIMVIPLFVTPLLLKFGGGILAQFGGIVKGAISKPRAAAMSAAQDFRKSRKTLQRARGANGRIVFGKIPLGGDSKWGRRVGKLNNFRPGNVAAAVRMGQDRRASNAARAAETYNAQNTAGYLSGVHDEAARSDLASTLLANIGNVDLKNVEADAATLRAMHTPDQLKQMSTTGKDANGITLTEQQRRAAQMALMNNATLEDVHELIQASDTMDIKQRADLVNLIRKGGFTGKAPHLSAGALNNIIAGADGANDVNQLIVNGANAGRFSSGAKLSDAGKDTIDRLHSAMQGGQITSVRMNEVINQAKSEIANGRVRVESSAKIAEIANMRVT